MSSEDIVIAVNSGSIYNQEAAPFLSYPLLHGPCRFLQYPVLDIFYEACDAAGVRCQHAMSFRDPYRTLRSTSMNRNFASRHVQLQTLHSMLGIIQGQMLSHPDRNVACWESDKGADGGAGDLGALFGWKNPAKFGEFYNKIFLEPSALSEEDRLEITKEKQRGLHEQHGPRYGQGEESVQAASRSKINKYIGHRFIVTKASCHLTTSIYFENADGGRFIISSYHVDYTSPISGRGIGRSDVSSTRLGE